MGVFEHFPYTNFHELNLDWILRKIRRFQAIVDSIPDLIEKEVSEQLDDANLEQIIIDLYTQYNGWINVKYPPENLTPAVGDGDTDDTEALQAILNYACQHKGMMIIFPDGLYKVSGLTINCVTRMFGISNGRPTLLLKGNTSNPIITAHADLTLENINLNGNAESQITSNPLIVQDTGNIIFNNVYAEGGSILLKKTDPTGVVLGNVSCSGQTEKTFDLANSRFYATANITHGANNIPMGTIGATSSVIELNFDTEPPETGNVFTGDYNIIISSINIPCADRKHNTFISPQEIDIRSEDLLVNTMNPITYREPVEGSTYYDSIPMLSTTGTPYSVMVENGNVTKFNQYAANVKQYGAVGDGVADDTAAIQQALNENNFVYIPSGQYKITSTLQLKSNQTLIGAGISSTLLIPSGGTEINAPVLSGNNGNAVGSSSTDIINNLTISNIGVRYSNATPRTQPVIYILNPAFCSFDSVGLFNTSTVLNNTINNSFYLQSNTAETWVNRITKCHLWYAEFVLNGVTDNYITNNYFGGASTHQALELVNSPGNIITGNMILSTLLLASGSANQIITSNFFDWGEQVNITKQSIPALLVTGDARNITISNNRFYNITADAIHMSTNINAVVISGNIFENCDAFAEGANDVTLNFTNPNGLLKNISISNNQHVREKYFTKSSGAINDRTTSQPINKAYGISFENSEEISSLSSKIFVNNISLYKPECYALQDINNLICYNNCTPFANFGGIEGGVYRTSSGRVIETLEFTGTAISKTYDFPIPYTGVPIVLTQLTQDIEGVSHKITGITATNFTVSYEFEGGTGTKQFTIQWLASTLN